MIEVGALSDVSLELPQAANLSDRIVMMHKGRVLHELRGNERARARPQDLLGRFEEVRRRRRLDTSVAEMLKRDYI